MPFLYALFLLLLLGCEPTMVRAGAASVNSATPHPGPPASGEVRDLEDAARALLAGSEGEAGHPFEGAHYAGPSTHPGASDCVICHLQSEHGETSTDRWAPVVATCEGCHEGAASTREIRKTHTADHDGDGNNTEPLADEIDGLLADLLTTIQASALTTGAPICYHRSRYPHWMNDTDGDGTCSAEEARASNAYEIWTEPMLRASCNFQAVSRNRGAWAHNFDYAVQLVIDSIAVLGGDTSRYVRPE